MEHFFDKIDGWAHPYDQGNLIKLILNELNKESLTIAEIGVYKGRGTAMWNVELINSGISYEYYAIDHFLGSNEHEKGVDYYNITLENLKPVIHKINLIKNDSLSESKNYDNEYFDVVYIDASHEYEYVKNDILSWLPKVKKGGIICGDDYVGAWPGVIQAVDEVFGDGFTVGISDFVYTKSYRVNIIGNQQWWVKI
jgi:predicted O-methyltransferase YrrM